MEDKPKELNVSQATGLALLSNVPELYRNKVVIHLTEEWPQRRGLKTITQIKKHLKTLCTQTELSKIYSETERKLNFANEAKDIEMSNAALETLKAAAYLILEGPDITFKENLLSDKEGNIIGLKNPDVDKDRFGTCFEESKRDLTKQLPTINAESRGVTGIFDQMYGKKRIRKTKKRKNKRKHTKRKLRR